MRYGLDPNRERALQRQLRQELAQSEKNDA
jgi:hypothetical protein